MSDPVTVRPARPFDAAFAVPLIQETIGKIGLALTATSSATEAQRVLLGFFPLRDNRLSHQNVLIAERAGQPLGLAVTYAGADAARLDEPFRERLRALGLPGEVISEGTPGELYVDTLAVLPGARGQGVGTLLLSAAADRAAGLGLTQVGLLVEDGNPAARLYGRLGFRPAGTRRLAGGTYTHLVRALV
ncbi:GNAT family N-acetyltransferase [Deinococcus taeanensis]|uniref:GNAT family N-acetyltransferase n=1 Tax=Deinococcus taeanensis TaxID=2737050 RepID=UPI001CDBE9BC|nr:GNAT family N-acetyltransferase [Deinococcus taeanensis]UBV43398.1 GNAT family N-acetyltransferase [Deinococcus taeanensis]